jgi:hypothetical protein
MSETFQPNEPLSATLEAQEWNVVFAGLGELAMKYSGPVANKIRMQLSQAQTVPSPIPEDVQAKMRMYARGNGAADHTESYDGS